ncbi:hypothetical protein DE146DRAFT_47825 [Phaeosphaeria sp. MPI-PUGE-AT-0046c]|nr:hypothetical protein DE146DRAFT_47825 [Phaeosphaeria sp. MPI-PUGE-AT-0046c]
MLHDHYLSAGIWRGWMALTAQPASCRRSPRAMDQTTSAASPGRPIPRAYRHDAREGAYLGTDHSHNGNIRGSQASSGELVARDTADAQWLHDGLMYCTVYSDLSTDRAGGRGHAPALACSRLHVDRGPKRCWRRQMHRQRANGSAAGGYCSRQHIHHAKGSATLPNGGASMRRSRVRAQCPRQTRSRPATGAVDGRANCQRAGLRRRSACRLLRAG